MHQVDPDRLDLAREFKANPTGPHGPELQKLLMLLRWDCPTRQYVAVQIESAGPWHLAKMNGPKGHPLDVYTAVPLASQADAFWAVFRKRWELRTGRRLLLDGDDVPDPTRTAPVPSTGLVRKPLLGYADRFSVCNGEPIEVKVSAQDPRPYRARLVRLRCGDHANVGFRQQEVASSIDGEYRGRRQDIHAGSYVHVPGSTGLGAASFALHAQLWPTTPSKGVQSLLGNWDDGTRSGYALLIDRHGHLNLLLGDGQSVQRLSTGIALRARHWYEVVASVDAESGEIWLGQRPLVRYARDDTTAHVSGRLRVAHRGGGPFRIAAWSASCEDLDNFRRPRAAAHYNGKLEAPTVAARALGPGERNAFPRGEFPGFEHGSWLARWDFSQKMSATEVVDVSGNARHGETVNLPTRAMKGVHWDGSEFNFQHRPEHYGAIHFHDDDLYDCGWQTDFQFTVPDELPSGLYCAYLSQDGPPAASEDWIPFVVRPPRGTARAKLALLLPSASYWAYANRHTLVAFAGREHVRSGFTAGDPSALYLHHHPELGLSTYDNHSDGSGVCYSSRLRPVLSLRPRESLWQLPADTHIIDWLEEKRIEYDVITEDDLDAEGDALLTPYRCVMTGTHPEYPSKAMMDAYAAYQDQGGRFIYLGGNGFYWRVSYHPRLPGVLEMRRAEDGIRAWLAEGGEYYHGFTGELGGMWRRMGRAPQSVAGTGMTAQGFDVSTYYTRTPASNDPRAAFIFDGVGETERIGDFGVIGGGAAGWEIDRADPDLGSPPHALVVAVADTFGHAYHWMKEELTHTHAAITGDTCPHVHCDMVFYETGDGGAVFSTSSIAWAGALSHNGYDNNVSRITRNVIERFLDPRAF